MNIKLVLFVFLVGGLIILNEQVNVNALPASPSPLQARQENPGAIGTWKIVGKSGVNAMHAVLVSPRKVVFVDKLEQNPLKRADGLAALSSEYNLDTNEVKPLGIYTNTFCSAGSWLGNGTLVEAGGDKGDANYRSGIQTIRLYDVSIGDWLELEGIVPTNRWYPTMLTLPSGSVLIVGGSTAATGVNRADINNPTYTIYPPPNGGPLVDVPLDFLTTALPYNLYPFVHVIPTYDGKTDLFIFANTAGIRYNLDTGTTVQTYPKLAGGIRTYPLTGTSVMLPLSPDTYYQPTVMICGGNAAYEVTAQADSTCGRLDLSAANPAWEMDDFGKQPRVMPDATILVDGSILFINGAATGFAGYRRGGGANALWVNENPVLNPLLYDPAARTYRVLAPSTIPRMYHSVSTLVPDGTVLITGSNPQGSVTLNVKYSTEYRVEIFSPPYLYSTTPRPTIISLESFPINQNIINVNYGKDVTMVVSIKSSGAVPSLKACIIHHGFITHSQNFSQRYVYLEILNLWVDSTATDRYLLTLKLPPNPTIIPPGPSYIYIFNGPSPAESGVHVLLTEATA